MNSGQLHSALSNAKETGHRFRGVYARDGLPRNLRKGFYIVNFDKKGEPGSHWICIENGDEIVYFDSYGRTPPRFTGLARYWRGKKNVVRNTKKLQHDYSTTCGQWCMYFVWRRCCGWTLKNIVSPFRKGTPLVNDYVMNHLIKTKFGTDKKVIDRPFLKQQICKAMEQNIAEWKLSTTTRHKQRKE